MRVRCGEEEDPDGAEHARERVRRRLVVEGVSDAQQPTDDSDETCAGKELADNGGGGCGGRALLVDEVAEEEQVKEHEDE